MLMSAKPKKDSINIQFIIEKTGEGDNFMKVGKLIEELKKHNSNLDIIFYSEDDNHPTFFDLVEISTKDIEMSRDPYGRSLSRYEKSENRSDLSYRANRSETS